MKILTVNNVFAPFRGLDTRISVFKDRQRDGQVL